MNTNMNRKVAGYFLALSAIGMILHLLSGDLAGICHLNEIDVPIARGIMEHFSTAITAFVGGNIAPNLFNFLFNTNNQDKVSDSKRAEINQSGV